MVSEVDNPDVLPLAIYSEFSNKVYSKKKSQHLTDKDKNISKAAGEGDLSPKHVDILKESHKKRKIKDVLGIFLNRHIQDK